MADTEPWRPGLALLTSHFSSLGLVFLTYKVGAIVIVLVYKVQEA